MGSLGLPGEITTADVALGESQKSRSVHNLLPGIPDDVVLSEIVPKLQWQDFFILASVSHAWHNAIRSGRVFNSRVLFHSETVIPVCYASNHGHFAHSTIALYSLRDNSWHKLPRITNVLGSRDGIPAFGQCISMDGKIYVMGGVMNSETSNKVFVFDVARQGGWQQCASMKQRRRQFAAVVIDGKIYVFGGKIGTIAYNFGGVFGVHSRIHETSILTPIADSEVYDPKEDTWSTIRPMTTCRSDQHVTAIGKEFFVHGDCTAYTTRYTHDNLTQSRVYSLDAYHPLEDEWRVVQPSWNRPKYALFFTFQGNVFAVSRAEDTHGILSRNRAWNRLHIYKYDIHGNSWIDMHSFEAFTGLLADEHFSIQPDTILAADGELIAIVSCYERLTQKRRVCLFQSRGFGSENQQISWNLSAITSTQFNGKAHYFIQML